MCIFFFTERAENCGVKNPILDSGDYRRKTFMSRNNYSKTWNDLSYTNDMAESHQFRKNSFVYREFANQNYFDYTV